MVNHGLLVCSFFAKKRHSKGEEKIKLNKTYQPQIGDQMFSFEDFISLFYRFSNDHKEMHDDDKLQKVFSVKENSLNSYETDTYKALSIVIRSGSYGIESDLTDRTTKAINHHRSTNEADVKEFHCLVYVPKDAGTVVVEKGILIFESIASYGVKTITRKYFREYAADMGLTFETRSVSVGALIEKLTEQGRLQKISIIKDHVSPNDADNMLLNVGREEKSYVNPNLSPIWLEKIKNIFDRADRTGVYEIKDEDFDDISLQFDMGGRRRTVRLRNLDKQSIVEDVPEYVIDRGEDALIGYMLETAEAYKEKMIFEGIGEQ